MIFNSNRLFLKTGLAALLSTSMLSSAFAFDAQSYVERYRKLAEAIGYTFTQGSIEPTGEKSFQLKNVEFRPLGKTDGEPLKIAEIDIKGITELAGNGFAAETLTVNGVSFLGKSDGKEMIVNMDRLDASGLYYPDFTLPDAEIAFFDETKLSSTPLTFTLEGKELAAIGEISLTSSWTENKTQNISKASIKDVQFDLTAIDDPKFKAQREAIGYDEIEMDVDLVVDSNLETGDINMTQYSFSGDDIGKIDFTMAVGGYTMDVVRDMQKKSAEIQKLPPEEMQAAALGMYAGMTDVVLKSMKIRFDDASITNRIVQMQAKAAGKEPAEIAAMVPTMALILGSQLQNPEFAGTMADAIGRYMDNPGNLTIAANPTEPVSIAEITQISQTQPQSLIEKLGVTVTANE